MPMAARCRTPAGLAALLGLAWTTAAPALDSGGVLMREITLVASRAGERELLLRSRRASLDPATRRARLWDVSAEVVDAGEDRRLRIECDRAEVEIETQNFRAEGRVRGDTGEGQRFSTDAVHYDHASEVLSSDSAVELIDATGSLRGDGFRYHVAERRFELLGNVRVEQDP